MTIEIPAPGHPRYRTARALAVTGILAAAPLAASTLGATPAFASDELTVSSTTLTFPATPVGDLSSTLAVTITNGTASPVTTGVGGGALTSGTNFVYDGENCPTTLGPGDSCAASYQFSPKSVASDLSDVAVLTVQASSVTIHLHGKGVPDFTVSPTTLVFPNTVVGSSTSMQSVVLTNVSSTAHSPSLAGGALFHHIDFASDGQTCGSVPPGGSCAFRYHFAPTTVGALTDGTTIGVDGINYPITLSGKGITGIDVTPTTLTFPDTAVGSLSAPLEVTLTNITTQILHPGIGGGALTGGTNFIYNGENCPDALAPGAACQASYTFAPKSDGRHTDTATLMVAGTTVTISLVGGHGTTTTSTHTTAAHTATHTSSPTTHETAHTTTQAPATTRRPVSSNPAASAGGGLASGEATLAGASGSAEPSGSALPSGIASGSAGSGIPSSLASPTTTVTDASLVAVSATTSGSPWRIIWIVIAVLAVLGIGAGAFALGRSRRS